jgi:hypothetical protein
MGERVAERFSHSLPCLLHYAMTTTIPFRNFSDFLSGLQRLNRRAQRLGVDPLVPSFGDTYNITVDDREVTAIDITVDGKIPSFQGWNFVASVEKLDTGLNIFHGESANKVPERFKHSGHSCEHCNQNRNRNASYIVENSLNGEFKQVGSTCVNDFLGGNVLPVFSFVSTVRELLNREWDFGSGTRTHISVLETLAVSSAIIREHGFAKKTGWDQYSGDPIPTAFLVEKHFCGRSDIKILDEDRDKAEATKEWLVNHEGTQNDYLQKLISLCAASYVDNRNIGILASAIAAYDREIERKNVAASQPSKHVGKVGERLKFALTLAYHRVLPDYGYGPSNLYTFKDREGNLLKWKTAGDFDFEGEVTIVGTIKEHSVWNNREETVLTRCKVLS